MKRSTGVPSGAPIKKAVRNCCRRMIAAAMLATCGFIAPLMASVSHALLHEVRLPRIDSRVVENLQRWADGEKDSCSEEI